MSLDVPAVPKGAEKIEARADSFCKSVAPCADTVATVLRDVVGTELGAPVAREATTRARISNELREMLQLHKQLKAAASAGANVLAFSPGDLPLAKLMRMLAPSERNNEKAREIRTAMGALASVARLQWCLSLSRLAAEFVRARIVSTWLVFFTHAHGGSDNAETPQKSRQEHAPPAHERPRRAWPHGRERVDKHRRTEHEPRRHRHRMAAAPYYGAAVRC